MIFWLEKIQNKPGSTIYILPADFSAQDVWSRHVWQCLLVSSSHKIVQYLYQKKKWTTVADSEHFVPDPDQDFSRFTDPDLDSYSCDRKF